jgi:hypothetical protein
MGRNFKGAADDYKHLEEMNGYKKLPIYFQNDYEENKELHILHHSNLK